MKELVFIVEPAPEGGYTARADGEAIFTEGENWEEVERMARDAVKCHFEEAERPKSIRLKLV